MSHQDLIDGDQFEALARRLRLAYFDTHDIDRAKLSGVVLTHNSDGAILPPGSTNTREYDFTWQDIPANVTHWFAQNVDVTHPRLTPIPIGLERVRWYPELNKHRVILDTPRGEKTGLLYLNCNTEIRVQREELYRRFEGQSWVTAERGKNGMDFEHYARQIAAHKFVLCPDGNGPDTHRTWETLYLGSFPIVERHRFTQVFAEELPLLIVDNWSHVTEDFLNYVYAAFVKIDWNWQALTMDYWEKRIESAL